ncbi:PIG-L family deacetylase [Streptomyces sp. SID14478]|uniref:PIG-L deacetylase family protein n=1 Tax=Streptomyces sp. SID14478 TaxID=2706073 RepID=UPI0013DFCA56|nr:PIG-L family deacetylase [Streptomyces sp. SID14478]NEB81962.1 PIG-L family deacetylase [Streptomyces sp. SID14478]
MTGPEGILAGRDRAAAAAAIDAHGTPESEWLAAELPQRLPRLELPAGPVVVVAAHPDDEVLGFGGSIAALATAGGAVHTVCLTDGEASHGDTDPAAHRALATRRRGELAAALAELGPLPTPVHSGLPDTALERHEDEAVAAIVDVLSATGADLCVAPWDGDLHSDHEAAGRAARRACRATNTTLWSFPVWMWHWARPQDTRVPWQRTAVVPLQPEALDRKKKALARFVSQLEERDPGGTPVLSPEEIAHHTRPFETVIR